MLLIMKRASSYVQWNNEGRGEDGGQAGWNAVVGYLVGHADAINHY